MKKICEKFFSSEKVRFSNERVYVENRIMIYYYTAKEILFFQ